MSDSVAPLVKMDFFGVGVDQRGNVGAGFFDGFFCFPAECVAVGSGVAEGFGQIGNHFFGNAFVNGGGGGVVEINGGFLTVMVCSFFFCNVLNGYV